MYITSVYPKYLISQTHALHCLKMLREGAELTIQLESKKAIINMFKADEFEMNYDLANLYKELGLLVCTGGNLDLKERHFYFIK